MRWRQEDYLRAARRVRGRYARRPAEMHHRLRLLNQPSVRREIIQPVETSAEQDFAELVITRIQGGVLRYSDRQDLVKAAGRMGVGRFDANLIIAMAQHRVDEKECPAGDKRRRWTLFATAVTMQAIILGTFYWLLK